MNGEKFEFPDEKEVDPTDVDLAEGGEIDVEVVDDTPPKDQGRRPLDKEVDDPSEEELQAYSEKVQSRIKELTHARHDERRRKEALERERAELERVARALMDENSKLRGVVDNGSKQFVTQSVALAESEVEKAKKMLREAQEAFDTDAIIAAQDQLMEAKIALREAKNLRPTALQEEKPVVQPAQDSVSAEEPDEATLSWQAKNQWFGSPGNEEYTSFALGLHKKLVDQGFRPGSEVYFAQIDARMKRSFPELYEEDKGGERAQASGSTKKPPAVVASATRSTGSKKIQLTATQVALANKLNIPLQQYAAQVAKLQENPNG